MTIRGFSAITCSCDYREMQWIERPGFEFFQGSLILLCSWARHFTLTVPLSTQEYKVPGKPDRNPEG